MSQITEKPGLVKRAVAEFLGTAFLLTVVVGSGIMGERLANGNSALALLANSIATGTGLIFLMVASYITAAYWFTASTSFANPAVTLGRMVSDTFAGIRPADALPFIIAQFAGGAASALVFRWLLTEGK